MIDIKLNPAFADRRIIFGKSNKTLKEKTAQEVLALAVEARKSNNRHLLDCFIDLPELSVLTEVNAQIQVEIASTGKASSVPNVASED
jgi:hypothetical protein